MRKRVKREDTSDEKPFEEQISQTERKPKKTLRNKQIETRKQRLARVRKSQTANIMKIILANRDKLKLFYTLIEQFN